MAGWLALLAPYAELLGTGGNGQGQVVVVSLNTGIEFHAWLVEGCLDPSTC